MSDLGPDIENRLSRALERGAAGRLADLVEVGPREAGELVFEGWILGELPSGAVAVARLCEGDIPDWWDATDSDTVEHALQGLLDSTFVSARRDAALREGLAAVGDVPMPECSRQRVEQLAVLYSSRAQADKSDRPAIDGAVDRCVADLYDLPLDLLITIERIYSPSTDVSRT